MQAAQAAAAAQKAAAQKAARGGPEVGHARSNSSGAYFLPPARVS